MFIGELSHTELEFLEKALSENKGMTQAEYAELEGRHPYAVMRDDNALILSDMTHYGFHNEELNKFLMTKFGREDLQLDFFYKLDYKVGDYTTPHRDKYFVIQTTLVLLTEDFTGGELYVDDKDINLNQRGKYINFNGHDRIHSVKEVTSGIRSVLVVMFNKKQSLL